MRKVRAHELARGWKVLLLLLWLAAFAPNALAQISVPGYTPKKTAQPSRQRSVNERIANGELPLSRRYPNLRLAAARSYRLPALPAIKQKQREKRLRIGVIRQLPQPLTAIPSSPLYAVPEGRLAVLRVSAEKAQGLKLHFTDFDLPAGARLYVYAAQNPDELHGPYTGRGPNNERELWTPVLSGEEAIVELFLPDAIKAEQDTTYFRLIEVSHIFKNPRAELQLEAAANCNQNITAEWSEAAKATGLVQFRDGDGEYACTGTLLNTTDNSGTPYLLTANHCISTAQAARGITVYWLYDQPTASGQPDSGKLTAGGATLLATNEANDFTLMKMINAPPAGVRFSGWSSAPPADGTAVTGIHHPQGDYKRLSFGQTIAAACDPAAPAALCENFLKVRWHTGITEAGSSGSGLYVGSAADPQLVGILSGGLSSCANRSGTDYYGRFDLASPALEYYLTGKGCAYGLAYTNQTFAASGANSTNTVTVMEGEGCTWTARSTVDWITITAGSSGSGDGSVSYTIAPNTGSRRVGILWIAGHQVVVTQYGAAETCSATAIAYGQTLTGDLAASNCRSINLPNSYADKFTFTGTAGRQINIVLQSAAFDTFVTLFDPNGQVVARDDDEFRDGTNSRIPSDSGYYTLLENGTYTIEVTSAENYEIGAYSLVLTGGCTLALSSNNVMVSALGNSIWDDYLTYTKQEPSCNAAQLNMVSDVPWINNLFPSDPKIFFSVQENTGRVPRTGILTFGGIPITVRQRAYCNAANAPTLSATSKTVSALGEDVSVNVIMAPGANCSWKMEGSASWVSPQGRGGNGNGTATYHVSRNMTAATRSVTLKIAGHDFTIIQPGINSLCAVTPLTLGQTLIGTLSTSDCRSVYLQDAYTDYYTFNGVAGQQVAFEMKSNEFPVTFTVFDPSGNPLSLCCGSVNPLNQLRLPGQGYADLPADGNYLVTVTSSAPQKTGAYSFSFTGIGAEGCAYKIATNSSTVLANGTNGSLTLTVANHCEWTASANVDWITFPEGKTGNGSKEIKFNVAANTGAKRNGYIEVGGRYFFIAQDAPCSFVELSSAKATVRATGGQTPSVWVTTGRTCEWGATAFPDWLKQGTSSPYPPVGEGYMSFNAAANTGAFRSATIMVAGRPFVIEQWGAIRDLVSAADYRPSIAPGGLASLFGSGMLGRTEQIQSLPAPTQLGGVRVNIWDGFFLHRCELLYVSPNQINFKLPDNVAAVPAQLWLEDSDGQFYSNQLPISIMKIAPSLFSVTSDGKGTASAVIQRVKGEVQTYEEIIEPDGKGGFIPKAIDLGKDDEQAYLLLYGTGIRKRSDLKAVTVNIGGVDLPVDYAGAQGYFIGLDQINVLLPKSLRGRGLVPVTLTVDGKTSNTVEIKIAP